MMINMRKIIFVVMTHWFAACFTNCNANILNVELLENNVVTLNWEEYESPDNGTIDTYLVTVNITGNDNAETHEVDKDVHMYKVNLQPSKQHVIVVQANENGTMYVIGQVYVQGEDPTVPSTQQGDDNGFLIIIIATCAVTVLMFLIIAALVYSLCCKKKGPTKPSKSSKHNKKLNQKRQRKEDYSYKNPFVPEDRTETKNVSRPQRLTNPVYQDIPDIPPDMPPTFVELPTVYKSDADGYDTDVDTAEHL